MSDAAALVAVVRGIKPAQIFHLASATVVAGATPGPKDLVDGNVLASVVPHRCLRRGRLSLPPPPSATRSNIRRAHGRWPETDPCRPNVAGTASHQARRHVYAGAVARTRIGPIVHAARRGLDSMVRSRSAPPRAARPPGRARRHPACRSSRPEIAGDRIYIDDPTPRRCSLELAAQASRLKGQRVLNAGTGRSAALSEIVYVVLRLAGSGALVRWGAFPAPEHDAHPWIVQMRHDLRRRRSAPARRPGGRPRTHHGGGAGSGFVYPASTAMFKQLRIRRFPSLFLGVLLAGFGPGQAGPEGAGARARGPPVPRSRSARRRARRPDRADRHLDPGSLRGRCGCPTAIPPFRKICRTT